MITPSPNVFIYSPYSLHLFTSFCRSSRSGCSIHKQHRQGTMEKVNFFLYQTENIPPAQIHIHTQHICTYTCNIMMIKDIWDSGDQKSFNGPIQKSHFFATKKPLLDCIRVIFEGCVTDKLRTEKTSPKQHWDWML